MAQNQTCSITSLRAAKLAAREALRKAEAVALSARKALGSAPLVEQAMRRQDADQADRRVLECASALEEAIRALENADEDAREARGEDDPIEPPSGYTFDEIMSKLHHFRQRATYGAVAGHLGVPANWIRERFIGRESPQNSWVVSAKDGRPTDYAADQLHPALEKHAQVLREPGDLLAWLQAHRLPRH